jgi:hypothetical protein
MRVCRVHARELASWGLVYDICSSKVTRSGFKIHLRTKRNVIKAQAM